MGRLIGFVTAAGLLANLAAANAPCDLYEKGNTPCVAAHSTTRALYKAYTKALYQVIRGSDGTTIDIAPLKGGVANAADQDTFCANTTCLINIIYDQSGRGNHLTQAPRGGFSGPGANGVDNLASAIGAPVTVDGQKAYGVFISPGTGYRNDVTSGIATGNNPEGMYAVLDATHYNDACCFDYGNAETSNTDTGSTHMEAIYLGNNTIWGYGTGAGPWMMADLENGLFSGEGARQNNDPSLSSSFVTGIVKGDSTNQWSIRAGNGQSGKLTTVYSGVRPDGYYPMNKEGSIILGIGGDNSNGAQGTFYEGVMTSGYPTDKVENKVQANIVAAKYKSASLVSGPAFTIGSTITFRITTPGYDTRYIAHSGSTVNTQVITTSSSNATQQTGKWVVRTGLGNSGCYSFESVDTPGSFIRHYNYQLQLNANANTKQFFEDATFCPQAGLNGQGSTIRSWSYPTRFFRHYANIVYIASNGGQEFFDATGSFNNDVSFVVGSSFLSA